MEMLTFPILILSLLITLWLTSHIAKQLHARRWSMPIIFLAWVVGAIFSVSALVMIDVVDLGLDQGVLKIVKILVPLFFTTVAYMLFTQLGPVSAFTANIAGGFIGLILSVVAIVSLGLPVEKTFKSANLLFLGSKAKLTSVVTGREVPVIVKKQPKVEPVEFQPEPVYTDNDFLPPEAQAALAKQKSTVYTDPHYRDMSIFNARRAIGMRIRVTRKDGKSAAGKLDAVQGGDLIVTLRRKEGAAQVPIAMSKLKKLEVYR